MEDYSAAMAVADREKSERRFAGLNVNPPVFFPTIFIAITLILFTIVFPEKSAETFAWLRAEVVSEFDTFLMMTGNLLVVFCVAMAASPLGRTRLGGKDAKPDYSRAAWFSMMFAAGMGIGLVFFGVAEPVTHFTALSTTDANMAAPLGQVQADAAGARNLAMAGTIFHWALHPWAIYAVVGLSLAVFTYNFNMPFSMRSPFSALIGKRAWGRAGDAIDLIAVFATLFGLASSLGIGAQQAMAGITYLWGIEGSSLNIILLIGLMTVITCLSVAGGIARGMKILSEINLTIAISLMLFLLFTGSILALMENLFSNTLNYISLLPQLANPFGRTDPGFYNDWSIYYWSWWMSWAPFVGMFMARISRGRTVREFIVGALLAPSLLCIVWMTVLGDSAIAQIVSGENPGIVTAPLEQKLFVVLAGLPWAGITSFATITVVLIFFMTSWDSGTGVIDLMTSNGRGKTPLRQRIMWLLVVGGIAIVLLLSGGLTSLQAVAIAAGLPLAIILMLMAVGALRGLLELRRRETVLAHPPVDS